MRRCQSKICEFEPSERNRVNLKTASLTEAHRYQAIREETELLKAIVPVQEIDELDPNLILSIQMRPITRQIIRTTKAPTPVGPYNQAVIVNGMMFVAGQISIAPNTNTVVHPEDITQQTEQVMSNLEAILTEAGATWSNVVKTTIFLKDMEDFAAMNTVYSQYFETENAPARACVEVSRLPKDVLVEIECVAIVGSSS